MLKKTDLIQTQEYWIEEIQNNIYTEVQQFMINNGLNQIQLSEYLNVSKGYVSQILKGECNFSIKKLVELSLKLKLIPKLNFESIDVTNGITKIENITEIQPNNDHFARKTKRVFNFSRNKNEVL